MKHAPALLLAACCAAPIAALGAPAGESAARPAEARTAPEPNVKHTVIEDDGARIEELRVRGQAQRIVVSPKTGPRTPYEIVTGDGSHDLGEGLPGARGAIGKRVWNVLSF
jgi:hypothetical protein